jgi:hypothetical protein
MLRRHFKAQWCVCICTGMVDRMCWPSEACVHTYKQQQHSVHVPSHLIAADHTHHAMA